MRYCCATSAGTFATTLGCTHTLPCWPSLFACYALSALVQPNFQRIGLCVPSINTPTNHHTYPPPPKRILGLWAILCCVLWTVPPALHGTRHRTIDQRMRAIDARRLYCCTESAAVFPIPNPEQRHCRTWRVPWFDVFSECIDQDELKHSLINLWSRVSSIEQTFTANCCTWDAGTQVLLYCMYVFGLCLYEYEWSCSDIKRKNRRFPEEGSCGAYPPAKSAKS